MDFLPSRRLWHINAKLYSLLDHTKFVGWKQHPTNKLSYDEIHWKYIGTFQTLSWYREFLAGGRSRSPRHSWPSPSGSCWCCRGRDGPRPRVSVWGPRLQPESSVRPASPPGGLGPAVGTVSTTVGWGWEAEWSSLWSVPTAWSENRIIVDIEMHSQSNIDENTGCLTGIPHWMTKKTSDYSLVADKLPVADRGQSSVKPWSQVLMSRGGERGTTDLFRVQVVLNFLLKKRGTILHNEVDVFSKIWSNLRIVLSSRKRVGKIFILGSKFISKAWLIFIFRHNLEEWRTWRNLNKQILMNRNRFISIYYFTDGLKTEKLDFWFKLCNSILNTYNVDFIQLYLGDCKQ